MPGALTFRLLGPLEVLRADGSSLDLGGPQARLVLGRLLVADGRAVAADALVDLLWDQSPPSSATGMVQTYVSRLRRSFDNTDVLLRYRSGGYSLDVGEAEVDSRRFEQLAAEGGHALSHDPSSAAALLRAALGLWRGEVLSDLDVEFARTAAARLEELRLAATEDLYDAELRSGRHAAVVPDLSDAVTRFPLRERLRGLLALALYRSGRQADALATLDDGRRILSEELGLDPRRELRDLQSQILAQDSRLDLPAAVVPVDPSAAADPPTSSAPPIPTDAPSLEPALIGRHSELRVLHEALTEVLAGQGSRYVVIEGEPGIGKSTLAQATLREAAARGAVVRVTGTLEDGAAPAYGPWLELVRAAQRRSEAVPAALGRLLEGESRVMQGVPPTAMASTIADDVATQAIELAGQRGLVFLIEDLQWADPASLNLLGGLAPRLGTAPVLVLVTVRDLEIGRNDAVVETLAQLTRRLGTRRLNLRGLSRSESAELLEHTTGTRFTDEVVATVHQRSDGNPFFTTELARMIRERDLADEGASASASIPTGVRDVIQQRIARLPARTVSLLEVGAVLGRQTPVQLLARVADRPLDECLDDLEPALLTRLVVTPPDEPGAIRFTHALVRETLAEAMSSLRRARLHLRAADGITAVSGSTDDVAEIVAEHLWQAAALGVSDRAAAALEAAAQVALRREALVSAESLLRRAAGLYRAAGTEDGLAELRVLRQIGFVGAALHGYAVNADSELIRRARELARATDRRDILLDMIWADWAGCDTGGQPHRALRLVSEAEALVAGSDDPLLLAGVSSMRGFSERHFGRMDRSREFIERAVDLFTAAGPAQEAGFYLNGFLTSMGYRHWARTLTEGLDRGALEQDYRAQDRPFGRMVLSLFGAAAAMAAGDQPGLRLFAGRMMAADPQMRLSFWSSAGELYTAVSALQDGAVADGLDLFARGREHLKGGGGRTMLAGLYSAAAQALFAAGEEPDGHGFIEAAYRELDETMELAYRPLVDIAAAHGAMHSGDAREAARLLDAAAALATEHHSFGLVDRVARERRALGVQPSG